MCINCKIIETVACYENFPGGGIFCERREVRRKFGVAPPYGLINRIKFQILGGGPVKRK